MGALGAAAGGGGGMGGVGGGFTAAMGPEERMRKFYEMYEPSKVGQVAALWAKYRVSRD